MVEIEASLRDCTISYLSLENDQLNGKLEKMQDDLGKLNENMEKMMKLFFDGAATP